MDAEVVTRLRQLLQDVDMETATEKQLRKQLEQDLGRDLSGHKALIRAEIEQYLENQQQPEADFKAEDENSEGEVDASEEEQEEPEPQVGKKRKGRGFGTCILSEPLAKFMGADRAPRTEVVKKIWAHIREHDLQNPRDRRKILPDEVLGTFLTAPVNMMSMNSQLSKHCFTKDRFDEMNGDEDDAEPKAKARPRPKKSNTNADGEERKPRAPGKPVRTSDEMAAWLGGQQIMSRPQITSFFWTYIKSQNLLNPANKREVLCDDILKSLTGQDKILAFGAQKYFSEHILKGT